MKIKDMTGSRTRNVLSPLFFGLGLVSLLAMSEYVYAGEEEITAADVIALPKPSLKGLVSVEEAINTRRSVRNFSSKEVSIQQLSQLLWAAQGITGMGRLRTAPSAGALYPLEIYVVRKEGTFKYRPQGHRFVPRTEGDFRAALAQAAWGQGFIASAPLDIVICAVYDRVKSRYGDRAVRYSDMEAGHAAQNIHLQAQALGLGSAPIGAFADSKVSEILGLPEEETPLYIIPVGYRR